MKNENKIPEQYKSLFESVLKLKGAIATFEYEKQLSPKKKFEGYIGNITKNTILQARPGVDYENIKVVKEKHESGERERRGLPSSMEKIDVGIYHNTNTDEWFLGCATINNKFSIHKTTYIIDGEEMELSDVVCIVDNKNYTLQEVLYAKDFKSTSSEWMMLNVEKIKKIKPFKTINQ